MFIEAHSTPTEVPALALTSENDDASDGGPSEAATAPGYRPVAATRSSSPAVERATRAGHSPDAVPTVNFRRAVGVVECILDLVPLGVLVVDREGEVTTANRSARDLASARDGFVFDGRGRFQPVNPGCRRQFRERLDYVCGPGVRDGVDSDRYVKLPRSDGRMPLLVRLVRLPEDGPPMACVLVRHTGVGIGPSVAALRELFGLTPAEARLTCSLVSGFTISEYAGAMGITRNTARTQLASILGKTETRRQADLIRSIAGLT